MPSKYPLKTILFFISLSLTCIPATATLAKALPVPQTNSENNFIYSPYKDTSINMNWNTDVISTKVNNPQTPLPLLGDEQNPSQLLPNNKTVTLAFATGTCGAENWGGVPANDLIKANLPLFEKNNINYIISTGGAAGTFQCDSAEKMQEFIERYQTKNLAGIDFDIEGGYNQTQLQQLMQATAAAQKQTHTQVSLTLATLAQPGATINQLGQWAVTAAKNAGLSFNVNLMVMDYGDSGCQKNPEGKCDMAKSAIFAAQEFSKMYNIPLNQIELTPMIGENDQVTEVTSPQDAKEIAQFAKANKLAGLHYWSFDRDTPCSDTSSYASPSCVHQKVKPLDYDKAFLGVDS